MPEELTIPGDPALVVRDYGGDGPSIVLLHGLGGNALHWETFAPLLTGRHRVAALDLRCHGRSGDGPWNWEALVADVERVVTHLGLDRPAVVGHSAGGAVAALWARDHPECPGAVNLDCIRAVETSMENYVGLDSDIARKQLAELTAMFDAQAAAMGAPLPDEQYDAMREQHRRTGGEPAVEMFERNVARLDGARSLRPGPAAVAFREQWQATDLFEVFAEARCPLLVCAPTKNIPGTDRFAELLEAQRRGVDRDLTAAERTNPHLRVEWVPASHGMVLEQPEALADLVQDFLAP